MESTSPTSGKDLYSLVSKDVYCMDCTNHFCFEQMLPHLDADATRLLKNDSTKLDTTMVVAVSSIIYHNYHSTYQDHDTVYLFQFSLEEELRKYCRKSNHKRLIIFLQHAGHFYLIEICYEYDCVNIHDGFHYWKGSPYRSQKTVSFADLTDVNKKIIREYIPPKDLPRFTIQLGHFLIQKDDTSCGIIALLTFNHLLRNQEIVPIPTTGKPYYSSEMRSVLVDYYISEFNHLLNQNLLFDLPQSREAWKGIYKKMTTPEKNVIKRKTVVLDDFDDFLVDKEEVGKTRAERTSVILLSSGDEEDRSNPTPTHTTVSLKNRSKQDSKVKVSQVSNPKAVKSKPKSGNSRQKGGFNIVDPLLPLTPGCPGKTPSNRISFCLPVDGEGRSSVEDLASSAEMLFPVGRRFLSKAHLSDALNHFGMGYFSVCQHGMAFECSAGPPHPKPKKKKNDKYGYDSSDSESSSLLKGNEDNSNKRKRGTGKASQKIGCNFKINMNWVDESLKEEVKITNASYVHDVCKGDPIIYQGVHNKSHSSFHDFGYQAKVAVCYFIHQNRGNVSYEQIKNAIAPYAAKGFTLTSYQVRNLKKRLQEFLPYEEKLIALEQYQAKMDNEGEKIWKDLDVFSHLKNDDSTTIISEVHDILLGDKSKENAVLILELLQLLADKDRGFTYSMWINGDGQFIGCAWMTAFMRANAELFGSSISFDMCLREINEVNWPYSAITARNEFNGVSVLLESIVVEESEEAYSWISNTLFDMCPQRSPSNYFCVSGDGFFSLEMIRRMGFTHASFIMDSWHLRQAVKKYFNKQKLPDLVSSLLRLMCLVSLIDLFYNLDIRRT
jgi:hypothetical protein